MENKEYQTVILAGLLHDIGKFLQRGSFGSLDTKGKHPYVSGVFVSAHKTLFKDVTDIELLKTLVERHHESRSFRPDLSVQDIEDTHTRALAYLVSEADNLSSAERGEKAEERQDYKATPLAPVFGRITFTDEDTRSALRYHPKPLGSPASLDAIFPNDFSEYRQGEMNEALKAFGDEFNHLASNVKRDDFDCLLIHLMSILHKHTWGIPSNTQEEFPDVSLYDHLKTTAAIAACLYRYHHSKGTLNEKAVKKDAEKFTLVVGDLSGIQNYIFDISHSGSGGVARRLRARSLFVQLLTEVASHKLLHVLELPMTNILMSSGGKFYLLAPNLAEVHDKIAVIRGEIERWLLQELHGEIALNLAKINFGHSGFDVFGEIITRANTALQHAKLNSMAPLLQSGKGWNEELFVGEVEFGSREPCEACKKMPRTEGELCRRCALDDKWGGKLPRTRYIAFYDNSSSGEYDIFGYSVSLNIEDDRSFHKNPYLIWKLNTGETSDLTAYPAISKYLANHIPMMETVDCQNCGMAERCDDKEKREPKDPATFNCLAYSSKGRPLLGFLKADVDNLGKIFVFGLKRDGSEKQYDTVSRLATLSRMQDLFFNGWIEHLTNTEDFEHCYTVFSGGDDLFLVGPWQEILKLARKIREEFERYTGNTEITLSAGVFMNKPGFPISRAALEAEDELEASKHYKNAEGRDKKDAVTILEHTLPWTEWEFVRDEWMKLVESGEEISSGFLYNLLRYAGMWEDYKSGNVLGLKFQPLLAYNILRNLDKASYMHTWTEPFTKPQPFSPKQQLAIDNLKLITRLLIYDKEKDR